MRVVVSEFMSLDGVLQAPGGPDEDTSGGFRHGGWSHRFFDPDVMGPVMGEFVGRSEALLQGRRTYQVSAQAWPAQSGDPFSDWINATQKYVVSDTLAESDLTWKPTTIIRGEALLETVAALRDRPGGDIYVYGSLSLVRSLLDRGPGGRTRPHDRADHARGRQDAVPYRRRAPHLRAHVRRHHQHRRPGLPVPADPRMSVWSP